MHFNMPLISIITINYNNAIGLQKTIKSVISQTCKNIEFIVIDGNSTDGSKEVIDYHKLSIHYSVSEKDDGVFDAQNKGLKVATGDYLLVLNSGDELADKDVIETVFNYNRTEDILYGNILIVNEFGKKEQGFMPAKITFEHMMKDTLWHPVSFVKRDFFSRVGFYDTSYQLVGDYDWFLRAIFNHKASLYYLNVTVAVFYLGGISSDIKNIQLLKQERERAQLKIFGKESIQKYRLKEEKRNKNIFYRIWKKLIK